MTPEQESDIRWRLEKEMEWPHSADVALLLDVIDEARRLCTQIYEGSHEYPACMTASDIGDTLGLHLNE